MAESYVEVTMGVVSNYVPLDEEAEFWHWLGNDKFPEDGNNLTKERAYQIRRQLNELYNEFLTCYGQKMCHAR